MEKGLIMVINQPTTTEIIIGFLCIAGVMFFALFLGFIGQKLQKK